MKRRNRIERIFSSHHWVYKTAEDFLQSVAKKQDVFGIFTDWPRQEFDLPDAKNFNVLSNLIGIKTFAIGTGDEETIDEGATTDGDRTVGASFGFCCPGVEPEFFAESTNVLFFSLTSPMNNIALADIPSQSSGIISIKLPC